MNFNDEQRKLAKNFLAIYHRTCDDLYDEMHLRLERELNLDPESVGRLLEEEK